jgi:hypothetical protein
VAAARSLWFTWTAPASGRVFFGTGTSSVDTTLAVYTGSAVGSLSLVAGNDNQGTGIVSRVTPTVVAGTTYRIAVDSKAAGSVMLKWGALP